MESARTLDDLLRLKRRHAQRAAEMMARAFHDDVLYTSLLPAEARRRLLLPSLMAFRFRYGVLYGEVYAPSPALEGVAVWIWGEKSFMTPWRSLRAGGLGLYRKLGRALAGRLEAVERYVVSLHREYAPARYWHLSPVAVDPPHQGRGLARLLLGAMFARLDREGLPCFLETQDAANVSIYRRYGFDIVAEGTLPETDIPHWAMLRDPRA